MKISIITVNLNNLDGLKLTVKSVHEQSFKDFEYIIIDGDSSDGSKEYIEKISNNLNFWQSKKDNGIYDAMNQGLKIAKGEYIIFLNSGDFFTNNQILSTVITHLDGTEIVYGDLEFFGNNLKTIKRYPNQLSFGFLYKESLPHPASFIKKDTLLKVGGFDENLKICADWKFFIIAVCKLQVTYKHINLIISNYNLNGISSLAASMDIIINEKQKTIELEFKIFKKDIEKFEILNAKYRALINSRYIKFAIKLKRFLLFKKKMF